MPVCGRLMRLSLPASPPFAGTGDAAGGGEEGEKVALRGNRGCCWAACNGGGGRATVVTAAGTVNVTRGCSVWSRRTA